jgi:hypothetical protein
VVLALRSTSRRTAAGSFHLISQGSQRCRNETSPTTAVTSRDTSR